MASLGEAFLSASVQKLVAMISDEFKLEDFFRSKEIDRFSLNKLKITLLTLHAVLNDAEEKQITNLAVQEWLRELRDAVYDADNFLDEINTGALQRKVEAGSQTLSDQVWNLLYSPLKRLRRGLNHELEELNQRLEHFAKQKDILGLKEGVSGRVWHGKATSSVVDVSTIYGRGHDRDKLKKYLLSDDAGDENIGVVTIVGMGGLGKTTLAKLLYTDHEVTPHFNLKAWAHITKDFDVFRVTKTLLESVSSNPIVTNNLDALQVQLQQSLRGRKFLFVLDDLWDGSYDDWNKLKAILKSGDKGSKVIITTRQENVALAMHTFPIHHLRPLSDADCWDLLAKHAFGTNQSYRSPRLERIGIKIATKCAGSPLAAEALGGLLRTKLSEKEWNKILKSNVWDLPDDQVLPPLLLSYHYLPAPLKGCFAYCSIFPKHYELEKEPVVRLWMAEGLVHEFKGKKSMEEIGEEYFDELVSRSLIQQSRDYRDKEVFKMHDLINDLATFVSTGLCFRYEDPKSNGCLNRVRHLSHNRANYDFRDKFDLIYEAKGLRTFIALPLRESAPDAKCYLAKRVLHDLPQMMRHLRALSLSHYDNITELPDSIGNLLHLRYLDLSRTKIKRLPDGTCKLYNLQTLLLSFCVDLIELPQDIGKLINLRHIDLEETRLEKMPASMRMLQNLKTLTTFVVSKEEDGLKVSDLRNFPHLRGQLSISNLEHVVNPIDAFRANLQNREQIEELFLVWSRDTESSLTHGDVLDQLRPSMNLKDLAIKSYGGTSFPNWLGDSSFHNMVSLRIGDCDNFQSLPPLGQLPALKRLSIYGLKSLKSVGVDFYGRGSSSFQPFPSLENLSFVEMSDWEEWLSFEGIDTEFPSLVTLFLSNCPKLRGNLPNNLPSLFTLRVDGCDLLKLENSNEVDNINAPVGETEIPPERSSDIKWTSSLAMLTVGKSPGLLSLLETRTLPNLWTFQISCDDALQLLPAMIVRSNWLRYLYIRSIPSLTSFQQGLPTSLYFLEISQCEKLEFLPVELWHNFSSLGILTLRESCHSLESFPLGCFPVLSYLRIDNCANLKSFSISDNSVQSLSHLKTFRVINCPNLDSFPPGGLPTPNLEKFHVYKCEKLKSLPERINTLTGLQELKVYELPCLVSFAEEGFPFNLQNVVVFDCGRLSTTSVTQWGFQWLTSLTELTIGGDDLVNALMKTQLLPTSLVSLCIRDVSFLERQWLHHVTSLENLQIESCPNLEFLPEKWLPPPLSVLGISNCPLLEDTCQSNGGENWPKIAHVPCIKINEEVII